MLLKWIWFFSFLNIIESQYFAGECMMPRLTHGKVRGRSARKLIRFTCNAGYELVGNRYATCRAGSWDTPQPVCVRASIEGCPIPNIQNGVKMVTRGDAWVVFFCLPGFKLVGSTAIYCDGKKWNTTAPTCVDVSIPPKLSCDFESPDLCGWTQDSLHDFDWERLNRKTPSSFLNTGPSYDHTFGEGHSGYYMYIESSSRMQNETARLISPIFDGKLASNGCFAFYYHMFGREIGGLRVYQKPDSVPLDRILNLPDLLKQKYLIFEMWGNQGDAWYGDVAELSDVGEDFQIVVEGIRGKKFTSDIAIDDVAILQGANCSAARAVMATPPSFIPETCEGRCGDQTMPTSRGCACSWRCLMDNNCCRDYIETCMYNDLDTDATTEATDHTTPELPQTQKLVAKETTQAETTTTTTTTTTARATAKKPAPPQVSVTVTIKNTTKPIPTPPALPPKPTTLKPITTTLKPTPTTKLNPPTTTLKRTTKNGNIYQKDAISDKPKDTFARPNVNTKVNAPTTPKVTVLNPTTMKKFAPNVTMKPNVKLPSKATLAPTKIVIFTVTTSKVLPTEASRKRMMAKDKKEVTVQSKHVNVSGKSGWRPVIIILAVLLCCGGLTWLAVEARGARGRAALAMLRGRTRHDPEVRYLHADQDDE